MLRMTALTALLCIGACAHAPADVGKAADAATRSCPSGGSEMTGVTLFFGLALPGGGDVSETAWRDFLAREVTPRFPDGLSVLDAEGQWKSASTGTVVREKSRALLIWMPPSPASSAAVDAIRDAYKLRFHQESVMRIDSTDCVSF